MAQHPLLICAANFSEGRDRSIIEQIRDSAAAAASVLDVHSDADHNRCVITVAGSPEHLLPAVVAASQTAVRLLDIGIHRGAHPRIGVVDVVPFTPWDGAPMTTAIDAAGAFADLAWQNARLPSFFYDAASEEGLSLPEVRKRAFKDLLPSRGEGPHPTAGAVAVGARPALVAFNMMLDSQDLPVGAWIAKQIRVPGKVRALAFFLDSRGAVQVSVNLLDPLSVTILDVLEQVEGLAATCGLSISQTELVGLAPKGAFDGRQASDLRMTGEARFLEEELARCGLR